MEAIIKILKEKHIRSGGNCGTYVPEIRNKLNLSPTELRSTLNQMYLDGLITVHQGGQGKLVKLKIDENNL